MRSQVLLERRPYADRHRRTGPRGVRSTALLLLTMVLTSCASADSRSSTAAPSAPPTTTSGSSAPPGALATAQDESLGVDSTRWPNTLGEAKALLGRLPRSLADEPLELADPPAEAGEEVQVAGAGYGDLGGVQVAGGTMGAHNLLSAMFGLAYNCAPGSYAGTARQGEEPGSGPDVARAPVDKPLWFSCRIAGAEGNGAFTGHAHGWTSGDLAWLVIGADQRAARTLVQALTRAV